MAVAREVAVTLGSGSALAAGDPDSTMVVTRLNAGGTLDGTFGA